MNSTKRRLLIVALLVAILAISGMGTLAYFTAEDTAHNVITSGGIDIELQEWADKDKTQPFPEDGVTGVMPGTSVTKIAEVKNTGTGTAWVRVSVAKSIQLKDAPDGTAADLSLLVLDIDTTKWTEKDGWYYYNEMLQPGDTTPPLFTAVSFSENMPNLYQEATAKIDVKAQAVQAANNGDTVLEAAGWPAD